MTDKSKLDLFPTRLNNRIAKTQLIMVEKGHGLLKSKRDILNIHFRRIEEKYKLIDDNVNKIYKGVFLELDKARFMGANVDSFIKECSKHTVSLDLKLNIVTGLEITMVDVLNDNNTVEFYGKGSFHLKKTRILFNELLITLIKISSLKSTYLRLKEVVDSTNRRVNALEYLLIPKLKNTVNFINQELDEREREDFFRLKKVQGIIKKRN